MDFINRKYFILIFMALIIFLLAYASSQNIIKNTSNKSENEALFLPDLAKNIADVGTVIISSNGKSFKIHMEDGNWVMPDKYNYPVAPQEIRNLVQNSSRIKILEKKTSQEESLIALGLDGNKKLASSGVHITLLSADESLNYADYILGIRRKGISAGIRNDFYVRLANSNQAYLATGDFNFDLSPNKLFGGKTFAIKYDKLQSIDFAYPNNINDNFTLAKNLPADLDFAIIAPQNKKIKNFGKANSISTALEYMTLSDIIKPEELTIASPELIVTYKTFAGLTLIVKLFRQENINWLTFVASADEKNKEAAEEARRINKLATNWVYKVDFESTGGFYYKLEDLIKD